MPNENHRTIADLIGKRRVAEVANAAGVSPQAIYLVIQGKSLGKRVAAALAEVLGVRPEAIYGAWFETRRRLEAGSLDSMETRMRRAIRGVDDAGHTTG